MNFYASLSYIMPAAIAIAYLPIWSYSKKWGYLPSVHYNIYCLGNYL